MENKSTLDVVRLHLNDGRTIADSDVRWLVAYVDVLLAELAEMLSWVEALPVKHPRQAELRHRVRAVVFGKRDDV